MSDLATSPFHHFLAKLNNHSRLSQEEQHAILHLPARTAQVQNNRDFVRLGERVPHSCLVVEGLWHHRLVFIRTRRNEARGHRQARFDLVSGTRVSAPSDEPT